MSKYITYVFSRAQDSTLSGNKYEAIQEAER
jgi:hypothetical protein